jgi:hypothetical protein
MLAANDFLTDLPVIHSPELTGVARDTFPKLAKRNSQNRLGRVTRCSGDTRPSLTRSLR